MTQKFLIIFLSIFMPCLAIGQTSSVEGSVVQKKSNKPLEGAHVRLIDQKDSTITFVTSTNHSGSFTFDGIRRDAYVLEITYLGFGKVRKTIVLNRQHVTVEPVIMTEQAILLKEVVVEGRIPAAEQKGDTTVFNAQAFKVNPDATAEDLVKKMPGVTVVSGTVKAHGEEVQQVLVDGRQFFGNDPMVALRNLPAEVIDKVEVFDKLSDQSQLTGFNDGQTTKTMNIVTKPDRRQGEFGRLAGAYGTDSRYLASGNINRFNSAGRLSLIGLANNANQQNFSIEDILGVMSNSDQSGGPGGGGMPGGGGGGGGGG